MSIIVESPKKSLNKAFLKVKPTKAEIQKLKDELKNLLSNAKDEESEENHKGLVTEFLRKTHYGDRFLINTKDRIDLAIHTGNNSDTPVGVIIEAKKPANKTEMISEKDLNKKAMQELVYNYLKERITNNNLEVKHLIVTNFYEWYIFDGQTFESKFTKELKDIFLKFETNQLTATKTEDFYKQIAAPAIEKAVENDFKFTKFNLKDYEKAIYNEDLDNKLIELFKILSPEHLLKLPFANDSNSLNKEFYNELLHIIGLEEVKDGGKVTINRKAVQDRNSGSLLEAAYNCMDRLDKIVNLTDRSQYGSNINEQTFQVALELSITWVNRILFLKLLEAQLIAYNKNKNDFSFLNTNKIATFQELDTLFFQVLAKETHLRQDRIKDKFKFIPYLNSSLFDLSEIENATSSIGGLDSEETLPIYSQTVLKDNTGKRRTGVLRTLDYFFEFLEAYDFSSEGEQEIQEESKTLINASVLGLIFEKINGYRDGSFFTPGFITMYMCKEAIRMAVLNKFNQHFEWECKDFEELEKKADKFTDKQIKEANALVNSIRICDPAVGSGHFLVSALNEMIAVKFDLGILQDDKGKGFGKYLMAVENDELIVLDSDGDIFKYHPKNPESQRVQKTLFHEKQTIIENCLFGVDLNPNSVKICMLRLWIELLKNAYYKTETELETLPNIDINIKRGNSLISRFDITADLRPALRQSKWNIDSYRNAVNSYKNATTKEEKKELLKFIDKVKNEFRTEISNKDPLFLGLKQKEGEMLKLTTQTQMFELSNEQKEEMNIKIEKLQLEIENRKRSLEDIKNNVIYKNAFEWRFEFPEVLDDNGDFIGFDIVIGNPPYIQLQREAGALADELKDLGYETFERTGDIYCLFYEKGIQLLKTNGILNFITSNKWMRAAYGKTTRRFICNNNPIELIDLGSGVFDSATVDTNVLMLEKVDSKPETYNIKALDLSKEKNVKSIEFFNNQWLTLKDVSETTWTIATPIEIAIKKKIEDNGTPLKDWDIEINYGIKTGYNEAFIIDTATKERLIEEDPKNAEIIKPLLRGRDIKRYKAEWAGLWLINSHNGIKVKEGKKTVVKTKRIDVVNDYPKIYKHLQQFEDRLKDRDDQGEHWTNLRSCAYIEEFEKEKIIYPNMTLFLPFIYDDSKFYTNQKCFIITGDKVNLKFMIGFLNSKVSHKWIRVNCPELQGGTRELSKVFFENIPVPEANPSIQNKISSLVTQIIELKSQNQDTSALEQEIDTLVYKLYHLSYDEVKYIDAGFPLSEQEYEAVSVE